MSELPPALDPNVYLTQRLPETSLLWRLADYTSILERLPNNIMAVTSMIETPYTEYGIIDRKELFRRLLGSVASEYTWQGDYGGAHHLMWPRARYRRPHVLASHEATTMHFRGSPSLKVDLPRELHDYLHRVTEPPVAPPLEVMHQYNLEQLQIHRLYSTIKLTSYKHVDLPLEALERLRADGLERKLGEMEDGQIGLMPTRELLAAMSLEEARVFLYNRSHPLDITNPEVFFDESSP